MHRLHAGRPAAVDAARRPAVRRAQVLRVAHAYERRRPGAAAARRWLPAPLRLPCRRCRTRRRPEFLQPSATPSPWLPGAPVSPSTSVSSSCSAPPHPMSRPCPAGCAAPRLHRGAGERLRLRLSVRVVAGRRRGKLPGNTGGSERMRVGIEVGGTFTDLVAVEAATSAWSRCRARRAVPDIGAFNALGAAGIDARRGDRPGAWLDRRHQRHPGTPRRADRLRDDEGLPRHPVPAAARPPHIYDLHYAKPAPPVRRRDCFEVTERIDPDGSDRSCRSTRRRCARELHPARWRPAATRPSRICLLSAYAAPAHEMRLKAMIGAALPGLRIAACHEVAPEFREYERASTTALSAYVQPVIDGYLDRFEATLAEAGFAGHFSVMQSNGGRLPATAMRSNAITALLQRPGRRRGRRHPPGGALRPRQPHHLRHGRHLDRRRLVQDGEAAAGAGDRGRRAADPHAGARHRHASAPVAAAWSGSTTAACCGSARAAPAPSRARPATAAAARCRPSPTRMSCAAPSGPDAFLGGGMTLDADAAHRAFEDVAQRLGTDIPRRRGGGDPPGGRQHRPRHPAGLDRTRPRPARLRAAALRRRRAAAGRRDRRGARHPRDPGAAQSRRDLGARPALGRLRQDRAASPAA